MKLVVRILVVVLVIGALAAGGYWLYQTRIAPARTPTEAFTQVVTARQGSLSNTISVVGELDSVRSQELAFSRLDGAAQLESLSVAAGNTVTAGQVLATVDREPYAQALDQAKSDLQASEKVLADLKMPATELALAQADQAVAQAEYDLARAEQDVSDLAAPDVAELQNAVLDAQDKLAQLELKVKLAERDTLAKSQRDLEYTIAWSERRIRQLTSQTKKNLEQTEQLAELKENILELQADLARVQAQRNLAQVSQTAEKTQNNAALVAAQQALNEAKAGGDALALAKAKLTIQEAQVALDKARDERVQLDTGADATELAAAQADVDKKRLAVSEAEAALAGTELKAPFDGTVLSTDLRVGDEVTDSIVVLTMADLSQLQVVAAVDETTIRQVSEGQTAQISFDAFPGQTFQGKVLSVPLQGELQNDVMVYQVPLSLEGVQELPLLVGMTANVNIATAQVDNAVLIPTIALERTRGGFQVQKIDPANPQGEPVATPVEVGLSDGMNSQIVQGLQDGDMVQVTFQPASNQNGFFFGGPGFGGGGFAVPVQRSGTGNNNRQSGSGGTTRP